MYVWTVIICICKKLYKRKNKLFSRERKKEKIKVI